MSNKYKLDQALESVKLETEGFLKSLKELNDLIVEDAWKKVDRLREEHKE